MTRIEVAELIERIASRVEHLPGVSRRNPHVFAESKFQLVDELRLEAKDFRTVPARDLCGPIRPGTRLIAGRRVVVDVVRKRA